MLFMLSLMITEGIQTTKNVKRLLKPILEKDLGTPPGEGAREDSSLMADFYD